MAIAVSKKRSQRQSVPLVRAASHFRTARWQLPLSLFDAGDITDGHLA